MLLRAQESVRCGVRAGPSLRAILSQNPERLESLKRSAYEVVHPMQFRTVNRPRAACIVRRGSNVGDHAEGTVPRQGQMTLARAELRKACGKRRATP